MSSSDAHESFKIGVHVDATDGRCGNLARLIFNPTTDVLTHLIVEPGHHDEQARVVPFDLVVSAGEDVIQLSCTKERYDQLDSAEDVEMLRDTTGAYDGFSTTSMYFGVGRPLGHHPQPMYSDSVPLGEIEIRQGDPVHAKDGEIGAVQGLVIDPADHHVTHVLAQGGPPVGAQAGRDPDRGSQPRRLRGPGRPHQRRDRSAATGEPEGSLIIAPTATSGATTCARAGKE